jgi:hypothetical protein
MHKKRKRKGLGRKEKQRIKAGGTKIKIKQDSRKINFDSYFNLFLEKSVHDAGRLINALSN